MFTDFLEVTHLFDQVILNVFDGVLKYIRRSYKHVGRINGQSIIFFKNFIGCRIKSFDFFNLISEEMHPESMVCIARKDVNRISFDSEITMKKLHFSSRIKTLY